MENYNSLFTRLLWNAGELLPGHQFRIYDFAVQKESGKIVLLTWVFHRSEERYSYIDLVELETGNAPCETFRKPADGEITAAHEVLKSKLIRIQGYRGRAYWCKLLDNFMQKDSAGNSGNMTSKSTA